MKRICFLFILFCVTLGWQWAQADTATTIITLNDTTVMPLTDIIAKGLPVMYVETVDGEEPVCDYVSAPSGCMGATIANATKVPSHLTVYQYVDGIDSVLYDSGDYEKDVSGMTIKLRGNTSAYDAKKPYKIKLQKKFDLLFRDNQAIYKDKEWLLLKDDYLTTIAGLKVNELVGMEWTPAHHFVNLVMNGVYRGTYLLCESVKRNPDCRLNVDKDSGFIFECDPYWWNEDVYVTSSFAPSYNYTFKYPDSDDILPEQLDYMQALVTAYERSINNGTYPNMIDVASFAKWCLVHDITGTKDSGGANRFYTKYDTTAESLIVMPLAWDFDMSERVSSAWSRSHVSHMTKFFNSSNRTYVSEFVNAWVHVRATLVSDMATYLRGFRDSAEGKALQSSLPLNGLVYGNSLSVSSLVASRVGWYTSRRNWLETNIMAMNPLGDVNISGTIDVSDVTAMIDMVLKNYVISPWATDINADGKIDVTDVTLLIQMVLNR